MYIKPDAFLNQYIEKCIRFYIHILKFIKHVKTDFEILETT